jgi:L-2-hydroxyglutarate oxidase LhgO
MSDDIIDTSGFYKIDGVLLFGPNAVYAPTFTLLRADHESYEYPVDGWYWFDSEDDARVFFGLSSDEIAL